MVEEEESGNCVAVVIPNERYSPKTLIEKIYRGEPHLDPVIYTRLLCQENPGLNSVCSESSHLPFLLFSFYLLLVLPSRLQIL